MRAPGRGIHGRWQDKDEVRAARVMLELDPLDEAHADDSVDADLYASMKREDYQDWAEFNTKIDAAMTKSRRDNAERDRAIAERWSGPWPFDPQQFLDPGQVRYRNLVRWRIRNADYGPKWHRDAASLLRQCNHILTSRGVPH
jgi:hypothetical protein